MSRQSRKKDLGPETSLVQENPQANSFLSFPKCKKWKHKTVHGVGHRPVTREFERNLAITVVKPVKARSLPCDRSNLKEKTYNLRILKMFKSSFAFEISLNLRNKIF